MRSSVVSPETAICPSMASFCAFNFVIPSVNSVSCSFVVVKVAIVAFNCAFVVARVARAVFIVFSDSIRVVSFSARAVKLYRERKFDSRLKEEIIAKRLNRHSLFE